MDICGHPIGYNSDDRDITLTTALGENVHSCPQITVFYTKGGYVSMKEELLSTNVHRLQFFSARGYISVGG